MRFDTGALYATVALIVGLAVLSGPLVGAVDFTRERSDLSSLGQGSVSIAEVSAPTAASLDRNYQSESYRLEVPDARINATAITGQPIVAYRLEIAALGYTRSTAHFLNRSMVGWISLSLQSDTVPASRVQRQRYEGTLSLVVRTDGTERVRYRESIPVEVTA